MTSLNSVSDCSVLAVANRLRTLRQNRNLTQRDISEQTGIKKATYAEWEIGKRLPSAERLMAISQTFGTQLNYLIYGVDTEEPLTAIPENVIQIAVQILNESTTAGQTLDAKTMMKTLKTVKIDNKDPSIFSYETRIKTKLVLPTKVEN